MKKIYTLFIALMMVFAFTSCCANQSGTQPAESTSQEEETESQEEITTQEETTTQRETSTQKETTTQKETSTRKETSTQSSTTSRKNTNQEFQLGQISGNVYKNNFAGFGCKLDKKWKLESRSELRERTKSYLEFIVDTPIATSGLFGDKDVVFDMWAELPGDAEYRYVRVGFEKVANNMSETDYISARKHQVVREVRDGSTGNIDCRVGKMNFAGRERTYVQFNIPNSKSGDIQRVITCIVIKYNGYMGVVDAGASNQDRVNAILKTFYAV